MKLSRKIVLVFGILTVLTFAAAIVEVVLGT